jgi:hypothetical protein
VSYDLDLVETLSENLVRIGFLREADRVEIEFQPGMVLCFVNHPRDPESLIGFKGTPWHVHGAFKFMDKDYNYIEMDYGDMILGLTEGTVLVCERWHQGQLINRWLTHIEYSDEFGNLKYTDELRFKRLAVRV